MSAVLQPSAGASAAPAPAGQTLISVRGLQKYFPVRGGILQRTVAHVKAVDGIDFDIKPGEH